MTIKEDLETAKEEVAALQAGYDEFIKRENPFKVGFDLAIYEAGRMPLNKDKANKHQGINFENISKALSAKSSNPEDFLALMKEGWEAGWKFDYNESLYIKGLSWGIHIQDFSNESAKEFNEWEVLTAYENPTKSKEIG